jgi:hypothetical protein
MAGIGSIARIPPRQPIAVLRTVGLRLRPPRDCKIQLANSKVTRLRHQTALEWNSGLPAKVLRTEDLVPLGLALLAPTSSRGAVLERSRANLIRPPIHSSTVYPIAAQHQSTRHRSTNLHPAASPTHCDLPGSKCPQRSPRPLPDCATTVA